MMKRQLDVMQLVKQLIQMRMVIFNNDSADQLMTVGMMTLDEVPFGLRQAGCLKGKNMD